ncbi:MAG: helix-turn-helix transcriptional regulator [Spirochaetaceae bacterium]|nr:helix-turn-helix transcriptional regulator [Spirochaetaceae bacterium]
MSEDSVFAKLLAYNVKRLRGLHKMSQLELSVRTDLSISFINSIENQQKWVSPQTLQKLACALKAEPHELFFPIEQSEPTLHLAETHKHLVEELRDILETYGSQ